VLKNEPNECIEYKLLLFTQRVHTTAQDIITEIIHRSDVTYHHGMCLNHETSQTTNTSEISFTETKQTHNIIWQTLQLYRNSSQLTRLNSAKIHNTNILLSLLPQEMGVSAACVCYPRWE